MTKTQIKILGHYLTEWPKDYDYLEVIHGLLDNDPHIIVWEHFEDVESPELIKLIEADLKLERIKFRKIKHYGNVRYLPSCSTAQKFTKLLNKRSLSIDEIEGIKDIGFEVEVIL